MKNINALNSFEATYRRTIRVYISALCLLMGFIVLGLILEKRILTSQKEFAHIINLSGRQRMLSQQIAILVGKSWGLTTPLQQESNNKKIKESLRQLEAIMGELHLTALNTANSRILMTQNSSLLNDFFTSIHQFSENKTAFKKSLAQQKMANHIEELAIGPILKLFDDLTAEREIKANMTLHKFDQFINILFLIIIFLILIETIFIFFPLAKSNLAKSIQILNQHDKEERLKKFSDLGEIFAKIVHEINNPLTVAMIKSNFLIKKANLDQDSIRSLQMIDKNLKRVAKIIKSTKLIYRTGKNDEISPVHLTQIIEDAIESAKILRELPQLQIETKISDNVVIKAQEHQIFQIIMNLITNAIDAVEHQETQHILIELQLIKEEAMLRISDNGPGVQPEFDKKIFQQLFTTKSHGTGIGLHESKKIIESYAGTIRLNRAHSNSSFEIIFPHAIIEQNS